MRHFWNWEDGADGAELRLEGPIDTETWYGDEVTPEAFRRELMAHQGPITLWINSPGGDVFAASRIYTMLMEYPGSVTVKIDGLAASAASVIAMAGERVYMSPTAYMMIHRPLTLAIGNADDMREAAALLDEIGEGIALAYQIKTGLDEAEIMALMEKSTWMNATSCVEKGFADAMLYEDKRRKKPCAMDGTDEAGIEAPAASLYSASEYAAKLRAAFRVDKLRPFEPERATEQDRAGLIEMLDAAKNGMED